MTDEFNTTEEILAKELEGGIVGIILLNGDGDWIVLGRDSKTVAQLNGLVARICSSYIPFRGGREEQIFAGTRYISTERAVQKGDSDFGAALAESLGKSAVTINGKRIRGIHLILPQT